MKKVRKRSKKSICTNMNEQKDIMRTEGRNFYSNLKRSRLFDEGMPPMAYSYSWAILNMLNGKASKNGIEVEIKDWLDGTTCTTL